jgi:hypothetical protein
MTTISDPREEIVGLRDDIVALVKAEVALAKAELTPKAKTAGIGAGMLSGAGYFALNAALLLYVAAAVGIGAWLQQYLGLLGGVAVGFVIVGVVFGLFAGILALIGQAKLKELKRSPTPELTISNAQGSVEDVKDAIARGKGEVPSSVFERREIGR